MNLFHIIDDAQVVLRSKGLFRQAKLYRRKRAIYAGMGGGFIRLQANNATSKPDVSWLELEGEGVETHASRAPTFAGPIEDAA